MLPNAKATATVTLKNPANEVIVPARGATNAKSNTGGTGPIVIGPPGGTITGKNELPNPRSAPVFANPPKTVANATGPT